MPFQILEPAPYRPEAILWLELPYGVIVSMQILDPAEPPVPFGDALVAAMREPADGPPRRPDRIRVANAELAAEVRRVAPDIELVVAPTPELGEVLHMMAQSMPNDGAIEPSYLANARIPVQAIERMFLAARALHAVAPWKLVGDEQVLRLDIPALAIDGACVSVIGALGESLGIVIFPSREDFERFIEAVESLADGRPPADLGTAYLSLNFERRADLPPVMRGEIAEHRWPVAGANACPVVERRDRDGFAGPLEERDVRIATACASALVAFFARHGSRFEDDDFEPLSESFRDEDGLEAQVTMPYG